MEDFTVKAIIMKNGVEYIARKEFHGVTVEYAIHELETVGKLDGFTIVRYETIETM